MQYFALIRRFLCSFCAAGVLAALPTQLHALDFAFPAPASQSFARDAAFTSFSLPIGPFANGTMQTSALEGALSQTAWTLQAKDLTTLQILASLRDQLATAGFSILFECETYVCGGFDFRFGTEVVTEPAMHVDLGDFRYLAAKRLGPGGPRHVSLIVSRSSTLGFVQITQIGPAKSTPEVLINPDVLIAPASQTPAPGAPEPQTTPMADGLAQQGSVALDDLIFASGAAELAEGEYASLNALATYLRANPDRQVALVGHTDASGGLAGNIALSRERAASVRDWMIKSYAIPAGQILADGVGYLAPRDSNETDQGRTRNRRVEAMLLVKP